jgi:acyl-CoA synthetase (AMP-forming)/AMP-acid ligase II
MQTLGAVQTQATQVLAPYFEPGLQLELVESERGTLLFGVPTMLIAMLEHADFVQRDLRSLRSALSGGATVSPELVQTLEAALNININNGHCGWSMNGVVGWMSTSGRWWRAC